MAEINEKTSVLLTEMDFFNQLAEYWWNENGPAKLLHNLKDFIAALVQDGLSESTSMNYKQSLRGVSILDAGCGGGLTSEQFAKLGAKTTGVDPSEELLKVAKYHASLNSTLTNLKYTQSSVEEHAEQFADFYDCVVSSEVIEHISKHELYLQACVKCLKPGGSIFISTFNDNWIAKFLGIFVAEDILGWVPKGTHHGDLFISDTKVASILEKYNCEIIKIQGMGINPFTAQFMNWPIKTLHYIIHAVKRK